MGFACHNDGSPGPVKEIFDRIAARLPLARLRWRSAHGEGNWPEAGVLVGLTDESRPRILLGRRAMHLSLHPGEVAFPGGKREREDSTPWDTALRETMEEVGLPAMAIHPLGELQPLITRTGFEVYPCIARIPATPKLLVDPGEFDSVFLPRLDVFADHGVYRLESMSDGERTRMVPHYQVQGDNVWGVTAAVLALVVNVAYDAGLDLQRDWKQTP